MVFTGNVKTNIYEFFQVSLQVMQRWIWKIELGKEVTNVTTNQIEYAKLLESRRSNLANEELTRTRDSNTYSVALGNLQENARHNRESEAYNVQLLGETKRSNLVNEALKSRSQIESERSNRENEKIKRDINTETERANRAREIETNRSNIEREKETRRSNLANEREARRHNTASEGLQSMSISVDRFKAQEQQRSNMANEIIRSQAQAETVRSNVARENETRRSNVTKEQETYRSNLARENETVRSNTARENETNRHNYATETENYRHNTENESISKWGNAVSAYSATVNAAGRILSHRQNTSRAPLIREILGGKS